MFFDWILNWASVAEISFLFESPPIQSGFSCKLNQRRISFLQFYEQFYTLHTLQMGGLKRSAAPSLRGKAPLPKQPKVSTQHSTPTSTPLLVAKKPKKTFVSPASTKPKEKGTSTTDEDTKYMAAYEVYFTARSNKKHKNYADG